jgi:hypothetical protein
MKTLSEWYAVPMPAALGDTSWGDCFIWCVETWGKSCRDNGWVMMSGKVYFNHEKDAIMFILRWKN